jgi:hypothetical protein
LQGEATALCPLRGPTTSSDSINGGPGFIDLIEQYSSRPIPAVTNPNHPSQSELPHPNVGENRLLGIVASLDQVLSNVFHQLNNRSSADRFGCAPSGLRQLFHRVRELIDKLEVEAVGEEIAGDRRASRPTAPRVEVAKYVLGWGSLEQPARLQI